MPLDERDMVISSLCGDPWGSFFPDTFKAAGRMERNEIEGGYIPVGTGVSLPDLAGTLGLTKVKSVHALLLLDSERTRPARRR